MAKTPKEDKPIWKVSQDEKDDRKKVLGILMILILVIISIIAIVIVTLPPEKIVIYSDLKLESIQTRRLADEFVY